MEEFLHKKSGTFDEINILQSKARSIMVKNPLYHAAAIRAIEESNGTALAMPENLMLSSIGDLAR